MTSSALVNLYIADKLKEEHYTSRLNDIAQPHGYTVKASFGLSIFQDHQEKQFANVTYRGTKRFQVQTTSSTYTVSEASDYIRELQEAINLAEELNEALIHIEDEIYSRYTDEYANNIKPY